LSTPGGAITLPGCDPAPAAVVRLGRAEDLPAIAAIQASSPEAAQWNPGHYLRCDLRVAIAGQQLAGFLASRTFAGESEILNLAVAPDFRRQGIARELLRSLFDRYPGPVFLEVRESNRVARNLYQSIGFKELNLRKDYYHSPAEAAIVLKFHSC
jgi:ribosomal-protein-alanine N-acetyltransferase